MVVEAIIVSGIVLGIARIARAVPGIIWAVRCPADSPAYIFPDPEGWRKTMRPELRQDALQNIASIEGPGEQPRARNAAAHLGGN